MEIIKRGVPRSDLIYRGTCQGCKSVLQAKASELRIEYDRRENSDFGRGDCLVCMEELLFYPFTGSNQAGHYKD